MTVSDDRSPADPGTGARLPRLVVVVPCFNEERRLDREAFTRAVDTVRGLMFLFVDDGSADGTRSLLEELCADRPESIRLLPLAANGGKAEAVRAGVLEAARLGPELIGYWDADLSTPLDELPAFVAVLDEKPHVSFVLGSRVQLLGRSIRRKAYRHYIGRVSATMASVALRLPVYDTQCGAKVFRCRTDVLAAFSEPFRARWIFDVEILARLIEAQIRDGGPGLETTAYELPLRSWSDVPGSNVGPAAYLVAARDLVRIYRNHIRPAPPAAVPR